MRGDRVHYSAYRFVGDLSGLGGVEELLRKYSADSNRGRGVLSALRCRPPLALDQQPRAQSLVFSPDIRVLERFLSKALNGRSFTHRFAPLT